MFRKLLTANLHLKPDESLLIVLDEGTKKIAQHWINAAQEILTSPDQIQIYEIKGMKFSGQEPPQDLVEICRNVDVSIFHTTYSLTHTAAGKASIENNGRGVSLPGVTQEIADRTFGVDYQKIHRIGEKLAAVLRKGTSLTISSENGTSLSTQIRRDGIWNDGGMFEPGDIGNLPAGEVFFAPVLGSTQGTWVIDASLADHSPTSPVSFTIQNGIVTAIESDDATTAKQLESTLSSVGPTAFTVAEIGIGTNPFADPYADIIESEKALGTAHLAVGNSSAIGGEVNVPIHLDGLTTQPCITIDATRIMTDGVFEPSITKGLL